jgi:hypothetical protein
LGLDRSNIAAKSGGFVSEGPAMTPGTPLVRFRLGRLSRAPATAGKRVLRAGRWQGLNAAVRLMLPATAGCAWMPVGRGISKMRILGIVALAVTLAGCAFQRAQIAQDARAQMIGMPKEQVLACMGAPTNRGAKGQTEVWATILATE